MAHPNIGEEFKPGQEVLRSGVYRVVHDTRHSQEHDVTCVYGKTFPPCNHCGDRVRFVLALGAQHVLHNEHFKSSQPNKAMTNDQQRAIEALRKNASAAKSAGLSEKQIDEAVSSLIGVADSDLLYAGMRPLAGLPRQDEEP